MRLRFWKKELDAELERKFISVADWPWLPSGQSAASVESIVGLPALLAALRLIAGSVGQCPAIVYREGHDGGRERAIDSDAWALLHDGRGLESTPSAFRADLSASLAAAGNAYVRKLRVGRQVRELLVLDPRRVKPKRESGVIVYEDSTGEGGMVTRDRSEILHFRTFAMHGSLEGLSPISAVREALTAAVERQRFEARHFRNSLKPSAVMAFPAGITKEQAQRWVEFLNAQHVGEDKVGKLLTIGGGPSFHSFPVSLQDAQFVEVTQLSMRQVAGIYAIPPPMLGLGEQRPVETDRLLFATHAVGPLLTELDEALSRDEDLFPRERGGRIYVEHLADALLRPDVKTRYEAYRLARQGGWITPNEIRRRENLPAVEGGDAIQETPVGGAPNRQEDD